MRQDSWKEGSSTVDGGKLSPTARLHYRFSYPPKKMVFVQDKKGNDGNALLEHNWSWGPSSLILQKWHVDINDKQEPHNIRHIWVVLPGLPMVF